MIEINDLTKVFGSYTAVNRLNLKIQRGEIYGFLGPNGAGKTTTLMMILGVLKPTAGSVKIFGRSMAEDPFGIRRRIGVVAEALNFYEEMTALEYLQFFAHLYRVPEPQKKIQELLEKLDLWQWRDVWVGGFSTGMKRKLGVIRGLLHAPELLILDEPVSGLDPFGIVQIRQLLLEEKERGTTILISSHILSEIERTADRVGIIAKGHLVIEDGMDRIRQDAAGKRQIEVELVDSDPTLQEDIKKLPFVTDVMVNADRALIIDTLPDKDYRAEIGRELAARGVVIQGMKPLQTSLEEAFITLTESYVEDLKQERQTEKELD